MKAKMLKIAGVKSEAAFYKKYPTEAAFFKAHPEAKKLIKAQVGAYIGGETLANPGMISFQDQYDASDKMVTGTTQAERDKMSYDQQMLQALQTKNKSAESNTQEEAEYGTHIPKAQWGAISSFMSGANNLKPQFGYYDSNQSGFETGYNQTFAGPKPGAVGIDNYLSQQPNGFQYYTNKTASAAQPTESQVKAEKGSFDISGAIPIVGGVLGAINAFDAEKKAKQSAEQAQRVSEIALKASTTRPEQIKRRYVTPWDNPVQPGQMFPVYGVGTNVLNAEDGAEIQNTYAPGTLYDNLGYEPLNDSSQVKQYYHGGEIPKALFGIDKLEGSLSDKLGGFGLASSGGMGFGSNPYGAIAGGLFGNNAGSQMGGAVGSIFGPVGGVAGSVIGGALDQAFGNAGKAKKAQRAAERNIQSMAMNNMAPGIQAGYASHMEDGGYLSHDYNPQVIAKFEGLDEQDFYDYAHDGMDSLRSGGHLKGEYIPVSARGLQTYAMGGELKTHWGGHAETMSHNPFLPGGGETVMFRGQSHDESDGKGNTGIGITYGNSPVEVERGEPAVKLKDGGTNEENLTVYGNLQIPNEYVPLLGDPKAKGKKFKNYVGVDLFKQEKKGNKLVEQGTAMVNKEDATPLEIKTGEAIIFGGNSILKTAADRKINAAHLQNAINDTAEEYGLVADDLAKGKAKFNPEAQEEYARYGKSIPTAQKGKTFGEALKEKNSKTTAKPIRTLNFDGTTRHLFSNGRAMDVDDKGHKKMFTPAGDDVIKMDKKKDGTVNMLTADGTIYTQFANGRIGVNNPDGKRYMGSLNKDNTISWDQGDLYDPETGGGTTPDALAAAEKPKYTKVSKNSSGTPDDSDYVKGRGVKWDYTRIGDKQSNPLWKTLDAYRNEWAPSVDEALDDTERAKKILNYIKSYSGPNSTKVKAALAKFPTEKAQLDYLRQHAKDEQISDMHYLMDAAIANTKPTETTTPAQTKKAKETKKEEDKRFATTDYKRSKLMDLANQVLPFIRPTDQEPLDPNQLMGEMYALSNNQVEPVQAQSYQPDLGAPYDISYQDMLNANQADYNATQRMAGYNPAALAQLNAQKYAANEKVLGEQFRQNQAMKAGVYDKNRDILNDAKLKNLQIYDQQYTRQSQAVSNSKAIAQAALNSISDKFIKNKAANRELGVYENMYNYRFDPTGRAINMNPFMQPNLPSVYAKQKDPNVLPVYDADGNQTGWRQATSTTMSTDNNDDDNAEEEYTPYISPNATNSNRNGGSTKKSFLNGSIVKSYKSI